LNYIVLAIPVFLLLILLELVITRLQEKDYYRLSDSISDLGCGILQQLLELLVKTGLFAGYLFLYGRYRLFDMASASVAVWIACFLGVDFLYYWFHRTSHEVNAFWAAHIVHHQSEEFNLSVALRQGAFQGTFSWIFYLPLAILGFPPLMFLSVTSVNTLYQFWIHTRVIGRLGPLEGVLNTPSNHRVHHGRDPKYIDRNHGGTLIVWDRLFGTYQAEEEEPVYGITKPLASWNPVWANLHYWAELLRSAPHAPRGGQATSLLDAAGLAAGRIGGVRSAARGGPPPISQVRHAADARPRPLRLHPFRGRPRGKRGAALRAGPAPLLGAARRGWLRAPQPGDAERAHRGSSVGPGAGSGAPGRRPPGRRNFLVALTRPAGIFNRLRIAVCSRSARSLWLGDHHHPVAATLLDRQLTADAPDYVSRRLIYISDVEGGAT
jgi:sterol desaturase/sphingolipid hydroxylase (fatty acid hydroxylase superfamily)